MFKNAKHTLLMLLPVMALTSTSCNSDGKVVSYEEARQFAVDHYDQYALDTVPTTTTYHYNKAITNIVVDYVTPSGGSDSFTISFGFNGIHVTFNDQYAISLSSTMIDMIEKYYSDFAGMAFSVIEETPINMEYRLLDHDRTKIDFMTNAKIAGNLFVKLLQFGTGVLDSASAITGFLPIGEMPTTKPGMALYVAVSEFLGILVGNGLLGEETAKSMLLAAFTIMDYVSLTVTTSSKSDGEVFNTYLVTDSNGFLSEFDFNFKSSFSISGLAAAKTYGSKNPKEGDRPISTDAPYRFTLKGSFDFDVQITSELVR